MLVALFEGLAVQVVQVGHIVGREQGPLFIVKHTLHEQVGHPVGSVHVMGTATVITGVFAQFKELFGIQMPGFQIRTHGAFAFTALVYRHGGIVGYLQEGNYTLWFAVGAFDVGAQCAHRRPVVTQAASKFAEHGVVLNGAVNTVQVVRYGSQVARGQLRAQGAGVEQGWGGAHVIERREQAIELNRAVFTVLFLNRQAHSNAHKEYLRQFDASVVAVDEVAVVQGLQAEVGELQIALGDQGFAQFFQIKVLQFRGDQFQLNPFFDVERQGLGVEGFHIRLGCWVGYTKEAQGFSAQFVHQQASGYKRVVWLFFYQGAGGNHQWGVYVFFRHTVIEIAHGFIENRLLFYTG